MEHPERMRMAVGPPYPVEKIRPTGEYKWAARNKHRKGTGQELLN